MVSVTGKLCTQQSNDLAHLRQWPAQHTTNAQETEATGVGCSALLDRTRQESQLTNPGRVVLRSGPTYPQADKPDWILPGSVSNTPLETPI